MKKRIFCLALALLMLVGMLPVSSFAEGFTPDPPECDKGCNQTSVGAHQDQCAVKEYYREIYRAYTAQELYDMKDILGEDAWEFILGASWSLDNAKAQELNTLIQNGGPTTPENPCACCEDCIGAEDCECGCGECQFCEPTETDPTTPSTPENPCKCCENCTGAEDCACGCENCQFCKPEVPENPCKCCENCTGAEDCECGCENCQFCEPEEPEYPILTDRETNVAVTLETLPEGVTLEVSEADVSAQLGKFGIAASDAVFAFDISLVNADNTQHQPGSALVKVPVSAPVGTKIGILHNDTFMGVTEVLSDNTVEFYTDSFSEFAGFTVDFHYEGVDYSIAGLTSIKLSDLFTAMGINEDAYSATSVVFSDNSLVTTERLSDGDWLLTSKTAFQTEETLIITFTDGHTIVIDVTDAKYPDRGKFTNHNSANDATFYHDGGSTAQGYRNFSAVSGVSSTWSVWDGGAHIMYVYLYDTAGNPVDYSYFDEHPTGGGYLGFTGSYWYQETGYDFVTGSPGRIGPNTLSMGTCGWPGSTINWIEVKMHSLDVLDNKSYAKITQVSKFAKKGETGNRTVVVYANNVEVDRKSVLFPTFEDMNASDISVSTYAGWIPRGNVSGAGATVVVADGVYKVYLVSQNTLKYDLDGGSGSFPNQTKTYGVQLNLHSGEPTKTGYSFNHWVSQHDGSTWAKGANFTPDRADTLVANYSPITYTATFNANGGSVNPTSRTFTIEGALPLPVPSAPAGHTFAGWKVTSAAGNWKNGDTYTGTSIPAGKYGAVTFTAQWNPIPYQVSYKYTGTVPANAPALPAKATYNYGTSVQVAATPSLAGYTFSGWSKTGSFTITGNTEITGSWSPINYTISYNLNGGTNNPQNPTSYNVTSPLITLKDPTPPAGYTFDGWAEGSTIPAGSTGNKTFTATWTGNPYYLTFYFNGGNDGTVSSGPYDAQMGTGRFCEVTWLNPNREGYDFAGWFDAKTGGTQVYYGATDQAQDASKVSGWYIPGTKYWNTSSQWIYTNNLDLYAHWTPKTDATYTVHYYKEGTTEKVQNDKVVNGATFDQVYSETAPETIGHYTLVGAKTQSVTAGYSNNVITFYYKQNASYSVSYQYTGTVPVGAQEKLPAEATVDTGASVTVAEAPTLAGYTFSGWTTDDATVTDGKFTMPAKAVTFTGSWSVNQYTVTYQYADDKTADKQVAYTIKDQVTLEDTPSREGYVFSKWKLATAPNTTWTAGEYDAKTGFNAGKYGNVTFVAQWKEIHTVVWKNGTTVLETDKVVDGESASFAGETPTKEKAGYECTFAYWFNDTDGDSLNGTTIQNVTKDLEIIAWFDEKVVPYAITYDLAGGVLPAGEISCEKNYTFNDSVTLMKAPTKDGYRFTGWLLNETLDYPVGSWPAGTYGASQSFNPGRYGNITLVAQWERQTGNLVLDYVGDGAPAIVNVSGEGLNINLVISADKTIVNLPTGEYTVTAQSGNASYAASVEPSGANNADVTADTANPATVKVTVASRGLKWFTGFHRMTNRCS